MKKLLLLFLGLTLISCSSDDESDSRTTDPIIGTWKEPSGVFTVTFQANGRAYQKIDSQIPDNDLECSSTFWSAVGDNPDFSKVRRVYSFTFECPDGEVDTYESEVEFSDDFNSVIIGDFNWLRQ
jgi:hypothetical protein